ncbi:intersectin-1 isoform X2 [Cimex lectularius]|uniref:Intersectin-1 n=1 Tax=Cimex lectularius TaxID=79782 RepID=A0A8I6RNX6_CIMLE|nr:intersectin-1 isoform X2 [Cimex lectularius]
MNMDIYTITPAERARFEQQFLSLKPINGIVTGDQAKGFLLQSQLPPAILGIIWALADTDADGKMNINEFSIACKLINLKLRGFEIPKTLPPPLIALVNQPPVLMTMTKPPIPPLPTMPLIPMGGTPVQPQQINRTISPPSGGPTPIVSAPPPIPPLPAAQVVRPPPVMPPVPMAPVQPQAPIIPVAPLAPVHPTVLPQPLIQPLPTQPITPLGVITSQPPLTQIPPTLPQPPTPIPPNTLTGLTTSKPSPPAQPTPPTPPIMATAPSQPAVAPHSVVERNPSLESPLVMSSPLVDWAVPQASKLKYTQLFNTTDKTRSGFLTGPQARNILLASKLPQNILATIWGLSDMDADGRLSCEEFVLALHLCDMARNGETLPTTLPPNLIPPTLRKVRNNSLTMSPGGDMADPMAGMSQVTFEDKRKENFVKGQAELDRRRKALLEIQRKEEEERERKEKMERDKQEKIRLEQETRRQEEIERQLERQREAEKAREEERRRAEEQREAARKEMERQRQAEWEKQRTLELENKRQKQQEAVLALKAKSQSLTITLSQKEDKVKELSKQISDTRCGVTSVKSIIDGMRATRDQNLAEYNQLKALVKQRNQQLVTLSQQKMKLEAQGKLGAKDSADDILAFNNKQIIVKNLKDKLADLEEQVKVKMSDLENNNSQLDALRNDLGTILKDCEEMYNVYADKRNKMLDLKGANRIDNTWENNAWDNAPDDGWVQEEAFVEDKPGFKKYRALYEFVARNSDELSFQPGDIIFVPLNQNAEPGWLSGEIRGVTGWFPESYVEPADHSNSVEVAPTNIPKTPLEGIAEVAETVSESGSAPEEGPALPSGLDPILGLGKACDMTGMAIYSFTGKKSIHLSFIKGDVIKVSEIQDQWCYGTLNLVDGWFPKSYVKLEENVSPTPAVVAPSSQTSTAVEKQEYISLYAYNSEEPGDLTFDQGETITVIAKEGDWWTGVIGDRTGIFPSNYVQLAKEVQPEPEPAPVMSISTSPLPQSFTPDFTKTPINDVKTTPSNIEPQITGEGRSVTPDFASLSSQVESGSGEESEVKSKGKKSVIATVIAPYQATSSEQLSLQRGQLIMIRKKTSSGWWEGELQAKGKKRQIGWFPASYVKLLAGGRNSRSTSRKSSESGLSDGLLERVIALYPYTAQNEDELSFEKDDIVTVLAKDEPLWWKGECKGSVGLFPSNYVGPMWVSNLDTSAFDSSPPDSPKEVDSKSNKNGVKVSREEKKRQQHINELMDTEQAYIDDMSVVYEVFEKPLRESKLLTLEQLHTIFINWHEIIECNYTFLRALRVRREMSKGGCVRKIGDILCENLPRMVVYVRFCSCQLNAATCLQTLSETKPEFLALSKSCQMDPRTQGLPLSSFLIKPMQRITKYPLLISKILECTPSNHPDRTCLEEAQAKAEELCQQINESVREKENSDRLEWLQNHLLKDGLTEPLVFNSLTNALGPRKLLHYGVLTKTKSGKQLVGFLMNDFLLLAQPNRPLGNHFNFDKRNFILFRMYKKPLLLSETVITDNGNDIRLENSKTVINLTTVNSNEKSTWLKVLMQAQKAMNKLESEKFYRQQSKEASFGAVGRILVMVERGRKLKSSTVNREVFCELSMGCQEHKTPAVSMASITEAIWNTSMQFLVKDLREDVLCLTVKEKGNFSPDQFLGRTELRVSEIFRAKQMNPGAVVRELSLLEVRSGTIKLKLDLHLFENH